MKSEKIKIPETDMTTVDGKADSPVITNGLALNEMDAGKYKMPGKELCVDFYHKLRLAENLYSWTS